MTRVLIFLLLWGWVVRGFAAEIVLIYPRVDSPGAIFAYDEGLDSTFVLGHVSPPKGELKINGQSVDLSSEGAFLAWLPVQRSPHPEEWRLSFRAADGDTALLHFPYAFRSISNSTDTSAPMLSPRVVQIAAAHAQVRTDFDGTYLAFPDSGCRLLATDHRRGSYQVRLGDGLRGVIEDQWVVLTPDSELPPALLSDGYCHGSSDSSECVLGLARTVPWCAEIVDKGQTLRVTLFDTKAAVNRIAYQVDDPLLREVTWSQCSEGVILRIGGKRAFGPGYGVTLAKDSLRIVVHDRGRRTKGVKGKRIVLDPGHGGSAWGAVGALGTREKDVVLRLAQLLEGELKRHGADVRLTRSGDDDVGLYERTDIARQDQADFLLSLHANALPDDENPLQRHGSATYYYRQQSRPAAEIIHRHLLKAAGLRDDGLWYGNLALARPTECPAVLVEAAYLIYPPEEELLRSDDFLRKLAKGLARGVREYFEIQ
jgi:N-acetylmuramoyl-L-alanine amidase